jgi:RNA polymerase sigma-54 factor
MAIELKQQLKLSQQLVMTPQLQQAIKLLQLSQLDLVSLVEQEMQENPVLEDATVDEDSGTESEAPTRADDSSAASTTLETPQEPAESASEIAEPTTAQKIDDIDWHNYMDAYPQTGMGSSSGMDEDRRSLEATLTRRPTLTDHLEWQLQLSSLSPAEEEAARWIIGNLNEDGYLQSDLVDVVRQSGQSLEAVESALARVQELDPAGVGARDLRECLLLQVASLGVEDPLCLAILDKHLDLLQKRDFRGLARVLGVSLAEAAAAARVIASLEPRPGRGFGGDDPIYITPDIYVHKIGDDYHIVLNEDGLPKLRISRLYRDVLVRGASVAKDTKEYVQDKVRSAMWLIKSIHQRQRTIYRVMESIIKHQREFFDRGVQHLRPLNLRDVAEDIGMHESTVSRVTSNKYANTPQGIFELKYFFNSSINRVDGDAIASESVKEKIRRIIGAEDSRRPLSDQRIAQMLKAANIDIARRTVTKYRESMNILSSTKRRQVG